VRFQAIVSSKKVGPLLVPNQGLVTLRWRDGVRGANRDEALAAAAAAAAAAGGKSLGGDAAEEICVFLRDLDDVLVDVQV
jgi:hypothetical protein